MVIYTDTLMTQMVSVTDTLVTQVVIDTNMSMMQMVSEKTRDTNGSCYRHISDTSGY